MQSRNPWTSRRWTIIALGMIVLLVLQLLGASADVLAPLAMGIGGAMTALQAGESWVDRTRARHQRDPHPPSIPTEAGPRADCKDCEARRS